ncbi:MAG: hypothetical protein IKP86_12315 [Anaerolineaceae bacterium]|nr:hypothetical protein [Anaerolineaceae bacterium]
MERYDFEVKRGETFSKLLTVKRGEETADLTGYTARSEVRENPDGGKLLCEITAAVSGPA